MNREKKSVARIVREINERTMREQSRDTSSPRPVAQKDAALLRKKEPGAHAKQDVAAQVHCSDGATAGGRKTLFFESIAGESDLHGAMYSQDTPESRSNRGAPFCVSDSKRHPAKSARARDKADSGADNMHRSRVTFAENIVTDVFYYEGSADVDDSEMSAEVSDAVPQSVLNTEGCPTRAQTTQEEQSGDSDAAKAYGEKETAAQATEACLSVEAGKDTGSAVECGDSLAEAHKGRLLAAPNADSKVQNIERKASRRARPEKGVPPRYGSPDAARVREEIRAIKRSLSIRDLISMFEEKIQENKP